MFALLRLIKERFHIVSLLLGDISAPGFVPMRFGEHTKQRWKSASRRSFKCLFATPPSNDEAQQD